MENKKYFYFRFTTTFFGDERIRNMRHVPIYGYQFIVIYLELCALSLDTGGYLKVHKTAAEKSYVMDLAKDIGEDSEVTAYAFSYFLENKLVEIVESPKEIILEFPIVKNNTGRSSQDADRKRIERQEELSGNQLQQLPGGEQNKKTFGDFEKVHLHQEEYDQFTRKYSNADEIIKRLDRYKAMNGKTYEDDYAVLVDWGTKDGKAK